MKVEDKSNEITAIPALLDLLDITELSLLMQWGHKPKSQKRLLTKRDYIQGQSSTFILIQNGFLPTNFMDKKSKCIEKKGIT